MLSLYHALRSRALKLMESHAGRDPAAWAAAHPLAPPSGEVTVRFIVPLISRTKAQDWSRVCENLATTVASLTRQTSPRWTVTICCQERPAGLPWDDARLRYLPFPIKAARKGNDKPRKQRFLIRDAATGPAEDGYLFFLDADDILHPRLVEHIVSDDNGHGYSLTHGYVVEMATRRVARAFPPDESGQDTRPFYRLCGSSSAIRFDLRMGRAAAVPAYERGAHGNLARNVGRFGLKLQPVPFPAALYVINHGDNLQIHRGLGHNKLNYLDAHAVPEDEAERVLADFGVPRSAPAGRAT